VSSTLGQHVARFVVGFPYEPEGVPGSTAAEAFKIHAEIETGEAEIRVEAGSCS
jgi:hypothetical protein